MCIKDGLCSSCHPELKASISTLPIILKKKSALKNNKRSLCTTSIMHISDNFFPDIPFSMHIQAFTKKLISLSPDIICYTILTINAITYSNIKRIVTM